MKILSGTLKVLAALAVLSMATAVFAQDDNYQGPVITVDGVCNPPDANPCVTQVTRSQFQTLFPNHAGPPPEIGHFAKKYANMLTLAWESRREGLDKSADFQQHLEAKEAEMLMEELQRKITAEAAPSSEDVTAYYNQNPNRFDVISVRTVVVPAGAGISERAEAARERLAAGDDPDQVQKDLFAAVKVAGAVPSTKAHPLRRSDSLTPEAVALFSLKTGEVSSPGAAANGLALKKVQVRETQPLAEVSNEIRKTITDARVKERMDKILSSANVTWRTDSQKDAVQANNEQAPR